MSADPIRKQNHMGDIVLSQEETLYNLRVRVWQLYHKWLMPASPDAQSLPPDSLILRARDKYGKGTLCTLSSTGVHTLQVPLECPHPPNHGIIGF